MKHNLLKSLVLILVAGTICVLPALGQTQKDLPTLAATQRDLKAGETHSYRIQLTAGQFLNARVEQENIDVAAVIFGPDGKQVTESDSPNERWGPEPVLLVAPTSGEYRVDIRAPSTAPAGRYRIEIVALRDATETDKSHAAAQLAFNEARKIRAQQTVPARRAAIEKYQSALPLYQAAGDTYRRALTLLSIGMTHYQLNETRKALEYFDETLAIAHSLGNRRLEGIAESWVGGMLSILGDVGKALEHYHSALKLNRENGSQIGEGAALSNIGTIYKDVAEWEKALEFYAQSLQVFRAAGSKQNEAITINNIGISYKSSGEYQKALDYLQQSLALFRAGANKNSESFTLLNIGSVYRRLNEFDKALAHYSQAQAIQKETGNKIQEGDTLDEIGSTYYAQGHYEKALEYHSRAVEIQRAAANVRGEATALTKLGEVYNSLDQPAKAMDQLTQALSIFRNIGDLDSAANALLGAAQAELKRGNLEAADKNITESLALIETVRSRSGSLSLRSSYRARVENAYEFYIDLLMQQHAKNPARGFDAEALKASERGRARSLLEKLSEAPVDIRQGIDPSLIEKERDLKRVMNAKAQREMQTRMRKGSAEEISKLQKEISALEDEYQQVQAAIRKSSPQYSAMIQPQPLGLKEIQQQLDPDTLLLEYSLGESRSFLWAVTPDSLKSFELPNRAQIEKLAGEVSETLGARSVFKSLETPEQRGTRIAAADAKFRQVNAELSRMILAPAAAEFGKKRLVVVLDGALHYVPVAALSLAGNRPIILDHEIVSLQSASAFAVQRQNLLNREPAPKAVAVIADPVFSTSDARFKTSAAAGDTRTPGSTRIIEHTTGAGGTAQVSIPRLPFTRSEADQILAVAPRQSSLKALDFGANRLIATSDELSKYRYVHFATHGYLDKERAGLSAIVLSMVDEQGKPQDGFLRTHDIYNLKLPAELVVLSACETGLGKDIKGEGLEGLTRGFMYAGARRVVVSLWNVNDKATAALMQRLYSGMLRSNKTPAAALRAAQIEMLRTRPWQSPYFWAGFVMQGEWR